jgi:hypothetical protein
LNLVGVFFEKLNLMDSLLDYPGKYGINDLHAR